MALNGFFLNVPSLKGAVRTVFDKSDSIASGSAKNAADTVSGVRLSRGGRPPPSNIAGAAANIKPNTRFELATPGDRPVVAGSGTALERSHPACATIDISRRKIGFVLQKPHQPSCSSLAEARRRRVRARLSSWSMASKRCSSSGVAVARSMVASIWWRTFWTRIKSSSAAAASPSA